MVKTIDVLSLRSWLEQGRPVTVVDVRPGQDWSEWTVPGSINVDAYHDLKSGRPGELSEVELPNDKPVVVVCMAGVTSLTAARYLSAQGYDAYSLEGGMRGWSLAWNTAEVPLAGRAARVIQVRRTGKGCLAYLIGSDGEAAVIDASLDPALYLELAASNGWRITQVLDTHVHADHLSRSRSLAAASGARLLMPETERISYPYLPLADGDSLVVGSSTIKVLRTPGHTLESTSYLLDDRALFTGDTLFVTGVGRPDLEAGLTGSAARAEALYDSLHRLMKSPSGTLILPGHTNKPVPFDGQPLMSTLAEVRDRLPVLVLPLERFTQAILQKLPPTPPNHHRIVELNEAGTLPDDDATGLEAGANRCAVS